MTLTLRVFVSWGCAGVSSVGTVCPGAWGRADDKDVFTIDSDMCMSMNDMVGFWVALWLWRMGGALRLKVGFLVDWIAASYVW